MAVIITTDIERAARRNDKTLTLSAGDVIGDEARVLAGRLGVRIVDEGTEELTPSPGPPEGDGPPSARSGTGQELAAPPVDPLPSVPPIRVEPASLPPVQLAPIAPAPLGERVVVDPVREIGRPAPLPGVTTLPPIEQYGAGVVLDPIQDVGRVAPEPAAPPPSVQPLTPTVTAPPPPIPPIAFEPAALPPAIELPRAVRVPVAQPGDPEPIAPTVRLPSAPRVPVAQPIGPAPVARQEPPTVQPLAPPASPSEPPVAAQRSAPTLFSPARPPSFRQRRQVTRAGGPTSQLGIILGRVIGSEEVRRAAESGVRLVRIGPESYVTRSARHLAAQLGVVLYPDTSLVDVGDRTKAGSVVNPISMEPAITRRGAGIMHTDGIPIGSDHLPGSLGDPNDA